MKFKSIMKTVAVADSLAYLAAIATNPDHSRNQRLRAFSTVRIAHRGFHDESVDIYENTVPAFQRAITYGFGIELDVRLTKDFVPVVFHDDSLQRLCGTNKKIESLTFKELSDFSIGKNQDKIPTLKEALAIVKGKVPLIIEIKAEYVVVDLCKAVMRELYTYPGEYCIQSFSPLVLRWFRVHEPFVLRGQLSTDFTVPERNQDKPEMIQFAASNLLLNRIGQPDFISYELAYKDKLSLRLCRKLYGSKIAFWTVSSPDELQLADESGDIIIFEGFTPKN